MRVLGGMQGASRDQHVWPLSMTQSATLQPSEVLLFPSVTSCASGEGRVANKADTAVTQQHGQTGKYWYL